MKLTNYLFLSVLLLAAACGSNKSEDETSSTDSTVIKTDSLAGFSEELKAMLPKFKSSIETPYAIDSTFIAQVDQYDSLDSKDVTLLAAKWFEHSISSENSYDLETFYKIDSIKAAGKYAKYVEKLDIGMTKSSNVYAVNQIQLDDKTMILVWALQYASYEACPYSSGTSIYFTIVYEGKITESFVLGETMSAGDPPVGMTRDITGKFEKDGKFSLELTEVNWDGDEEVTTETITGHYKFEISEGKVKLISEKKDKPKIKVESFEE